MSCGTTLTIPVGYTYPLTISIDGDGTPVDLTGWQFQWTAKTAPNSEVIASAVAVIAGTEASITIPATLPVGSYLWAIRATPPGVAPYPLVDNARLVISATTTQEP